jgi:hypothetical protein
MMQPDRIQDYLQRLTPRARSSLLTELERLEVCGSDMPGAAAVLEKLRAELRKSGQTHDLVSNPSRYFFSPLEPLLVDGAPEHAARRLRSGNGSAATCCRQWRATTSRR